MTFPNGFNTYFFLVFLHHRTTKKPRHILIKQIPLLQSFHRCFLERPGRILIVCFHYWGLWSALGLVVYRQYWSLQLVLRMRRILVCLLHQDQCICAWDGLGCHDVGKSGRVCSVIDPLLAAVPGSMEFVGDIMADDDPNTTAD